MRGRHLLVVAVVVLTVAGTVAPVAGGTYESTDAASACEGLSVPPVELDIGEATVGDSTTASYTFKNPANTEVQVKDLSVSGPDADAFSVSGGGSMTVGPGECVTITVTFAPQRTGDHDATLRAKTGDRSASTSLDGDGLEQKNPDAGLSPASTDFGSVNVDSRATATFVISNDGDGPLSVGNPTISGSSAFSIVGGAPGHVAPGSTATIQVAFAPEETGNLSGTLTIPTNDTDASPMTASVRGEGVETDLSVSPASFNFGKVSVGESKEISVTVENTGSEPVALSSISMPTGNTSAFTLVEASTGGTTLEAGQTTTVTVRFTPQRMQSYGGTVRVQTNDPNAPTLSLSLSGRGTAPDIHVAPASINFGKTVADEVTKRTVTVANQGREPLEVTSTAIGGANPGAFRVVGGAAPFTLEAGASKSITVEFVPKQGGKRYAGSLTIGSDDPDEPSTTVYLSNTQTSVKQDTRSTTNGTTVADIEVNDAEANDTITLTFGGTDDGTQALAAGGASEITALDDDVSLTTMNLTVAKGGDFSLGVTSSPRTLRATPEFYLNPRNGTEPVGYMNLTHTIHDEDIREVEFTHRVSKQRLAELDADVEEYALYRYHGGEWVELNTTVVTEADSYYVVRATSPGLSDFTSGVKQPKFRLVDGNVTVTKITTGEDVGVRVKIRNDGGADGTYTTKLLLNGEVVSQKDATISADSKRVVTFEQEISDPGTYTVVVNNVTISDVEVTAEELNQTASNPDGTNDPGGEGETNTRTPGFGLLVAIVALLAGALLLGRRD
jgi:PGF-CTERM protein